MKRLVVLFVLLALLMATLAVAWAWFNGGVSHRDICHVVRDEATLTREHAERRYQDLDRKLDRIEGKLDRLLKIAERPLPDGMQKAD